MPISQGSNVVLGDSKTDHSTRHDNSTSTDTLRTILCVRCHQLNFAIIWPQICTKFRSGLSKLQAEHQNLILQRVVFDSEVLIPSDCMVCRDLQDKSPLYISSPSGDGSWLELGRSKATRCTTLQNGDKFGAIIIGSGAPRGYCETDILRPRAPNTPHDSLNTHLFARKVSPEVIDYEHLQGLLNLCIKTHPRCKPLWVSQLETINLIDVSTRELVKYPPGKRVDYVALSYVWGNTRALRFKFGRLRDHLPATIEDAMHIVKRLNVRYLWVDSICINQADGVHKMEQINLMDMIYGGAFATIVALNGESAKSGLPGVTVHASRIEQRVLTFGPNELLSTLPLLKQQRDLSLWNRRGWTFQEGVLSHRSLLFSNHQVYFACYELEGSEVSSHKHEASTDASQSELNTRTMYGFLADPSPNDSQPPSWGRKYTLFGYIISEYANREFTKEEDVLNAITGLLNRLQSHWFPGGFYFGLPKHDFRRSLGWRRFMNRPHATRRRRFPSWSWAGWRMSGDITFRLNHGNKQPLLRVSTCGGESLDVEDFPVAYNSDDDSESESDDRFAIDQFIDDLQSTVIIDRTMPQHDLGSNLLIVQGILFQLKFLLTSKTGARSADCGGDGCQFKSLSGIEFGGIADIQGDEGVYKDQKPRFFAPTMFPDHTEDFLLLSIDGSDGDDRYFHFILLEWQDGIAYRRGAITLFGTKKDADHLAQTRPRTTKFLLG